MISAFTYKILLTYLKNLEMIVSVKVLNKFEFILGPN